MQEVNYLSFRIEDENGGSFQLLVDGKPLGEILDYFETLIPYWLLKDGIPTFPPYEDKAKNHKRIVAVCECGEYGCDCVICEILIENDIAELTHYQRVGYSNIIDKSFRFSLENFQDIEFQLTTESKKMEEKLNK